MTEVAANVTSLNSLMADVEAQLKAELEAMDEQLYASRKARGLTDDEIAALAAVEEYPLSPEDEEAQLMVQQFIDLINKAADAFNASQSASSQTFAAMQSQAGEVVAALAESQSQLPTPASSPVVPESVKSAEAPAPEAVEEVATPTAPVVEAAPAPVAAPSPTTEAADAPPAPAMAKGGMLLNYGKERFMRSFQNHYVVVSDGVSGYNGAPSTVCGVAWYDSEAAFKKGSSPIDSIPFFVTEKNSRGSLFKKAAVCWPLVTDEDCPKLSSADKKKTYFAVDYVNAKSGKTDLVVLGAGSEAERDEWVTFITKFIALYLPPGEEFVPFINFPVGANPPMHVSQVLGGEAPGSAQRVIDPTLRR